MLPNKYLGVGVGFKAQHFDDIQNARPPLGFFEVHAENYMGDGGPPHAMLRRLSTDYALSVHGVGLSIGSLGPLDQDHLSRLKKVVDRYQPALVSEHLAWSSHDEVRNKAFLNDLLPVPYNRHVLAHVVEHVDQVQSELGRTILIENPSTYLAFQDSEMTEIEFISQMQKQTGCGLILDINNVHISATNQNTDAYTYLDAFPIESVCEIHLAGFAEDEDDEGRPLLIDAHDRRVAPRVWDLYQYVMTKTGPISTLIEWDNDVPQWDVLEDEAKRALRAMGTAPLSLAKCA